jgi:hypothetical protein
MIGEGRLFGARGLGAIFDAYRGKRAGRRAVAGRWLAPSGAASAAVVSRDVVSLGRVRLGLLAAELRNLFEGARLGQSAVPIALEDRPEPHLVIGSSATIGIDPEAGRYVFRAPDQDAGAVVVAASEAWLIACVVGHLFGLDGEASPSSTEGAVSALAGLKLGQVERELVLQTLGRCGGSPVDAAKMLGVSVDALRDKLRLHRLDAGPAVELS